MPRLILRTGTFGRLIASALVLGLVTGCTFDLRENPSTGGSRAVVVDGEVDEAALSAEVARIESLSPADRETEAAALDHKVERALWVWAGLDDAVGGTQAADAAFVAAGRSLSRFTAGMRSPLAEFPSTKAISPEGGIQTAAYLAHGSVFAGDEAPNLGMALFGGILATGLMAPMLVEATNKIEDGPPRTESMRDGFEVTASRGEVDFEIAHSSEEHGVTTSLRVKVKVQPCPDAQGRFEGSARIEMSATAKGGSVGQKSTVELNLTGRTNDDAQLVSSDLEYRTELADFAGGRGKYIDLSGSVRNGKSTVRLNRSGGSADAAIVDSAVGLALVLIIMGRHAILGAAQKGWESGRCVSLQVTAAPGPSGLKPSSEAKISAKPRSRIDGGPTGGAVTAQLASGGASVSPSGTKVKADATFSYTAPSEYDKSGTVELEARSKRGVAKASITLDTKRGAYIASGGSKVSISGKIPDLAQPFTLSGVGDGFTVVFSYTPTNDRSGTVTYSGSGSGASMSGAGRYSISGEDPVLTLTQTHGGCVDIGTCATNTDVITLTREGG
ncbi:MAG TPA: hypothetical protein VFU07_02625 [Candidatus Lumbricidophila sp.]|nr:hypothetical protein [Candidatus Lumbricidophila sp.]